jgi:hypothetical protein
MSKTSAFQLSKGFFSSFHKGVRLRINCVLCKYKQDFCVQVKNKPCMVCTVIMRLISWNRSRGSEILVAFQRKIALESILQWKAQEVQGPIK